MLITHLPVTSNRINVLIQQPQETLKNLHAFNNTNYVTLICSSVSEGIYVNLVKRYHEKMK
jgi:hypothetical protein